MVESNVASPYRWYRWRFTYLISIVYFVSSRLWIGVLEYRTVEGWPAFHNPLYSRQTATIKHKRMNKVIRIIMSDYLPPFVIYCGPVAKLFGFVLIGQFIWYFPERYWLVNLESPASRIGLHQPILSLPSDGAIPILP